MDTPKILLVTVTKVETQAVFEAFSKTPDGPGVRQHIGEKTYYTLGELGGADVFLVQSEMGSATPGGALLTISKAIESLQPVAVIMVGIAFGVQPDKHKMGDILVSKQLMVYEPGKIKGKNKFIPRGDRATCSSTLLDKFRSADLTWKGQSVHFGLILSGEKLVNDLAFRTQLLKFEPEAIGGEMEGAGLYVAAQEAKANWILVKAICDWADSQKADNAQPIAAQNAAQFVWHTISLGGWKERNNRNNVPRRAWLWLALLFSDACQVAFWGWCLLRYQPILIAYLGTLFTFAGILVAIVIAASVFKRRLVLGDVLIRLGADRRLVYITLGLTALFVLITILFWPLGYWSDCCLEPTITVRPTAITTATTILPPMPTVTFSPTPTLTPNPTSTSTLSPTNTPTFTLSPTSAPSSTPTTIPILLDAMEDTNLWVPHVFTDSSTVEAGIVPGRTGNAIQMKYDLATSGGWVLINQQLLPQKLVGLTGIAFQHKGSGNSNTLEIKLIDTDGFTFGIAWNSATNTADQWTEKLAEFEQFTCWWTDKLPPDNHCPENAKLDVSKIVTLEFAISAKQGDQGGSGTVTVDDVCGIP